MSLWVVFPFAAAFSKHVNAIIRKANAQPYFSYQVIGWNVYAVRRGITKNKNCFRIGL